MDERSETGAKGLGGDIHAQILYRNTRLRVYRDLGIPVIGGWQLVPTSEISAAYAPYRNTNWPVARFAVSCRDCQCRSQLHRTFSELQLREQQALLNCDDLLHYGRRCCDHLAPLLDEDSEEVQGLVNLQMLENDASLA